MDSSFDPGPVCGDGPVVFGAPWACPAPLVRASALFARSVNAHLVCAFVDPAGYLAEWDPPRSRNAVSLDPAGNAEALFPAADVKASLVRCLGAPGYEWSFRVLGGAVAPALARLAASTGASLLIVGGPRPGLLAGFQRLMEGAVPDELLRIQDRPVLILPSG
ncbi:nucleotide-binding universal stress UspA family protein [Arthrobacter sp. PvP023]|uniref:universal stress protein n=1 Tax=Micrococcaceae TaxID=1268 RepID=UPI001AE4C8B5|nr:universal stress protein [Arthrobacter sp. PvP023]MBP1136447.1 nucleotide-binding universal stress UspA family protein [Arthrobacter sp. PvP023]